MKPLLIGQAPGPRTDPELPLFPVPKTSASGRLQAMMGLTRGEYLKSFDRMNLLPYFPGKHKRDDKFPMTPAKLAAQVIKPLLAGRTVILVGRNVADAFQFDTEFFDWVEWPVRRRCVVSRDNGIARVAVVPHPSGRNHWYNKPEHRELASGFWTDFTSEISGLQESSRKIVAFCCAGE